MMLIDKDCPPYAYDGPPSCLPYLPFDLRFGIVGFYTITLSGSVAGAILDANEFLVVYIILCLISFFGLLNMMAPQSGGLYLQAVLTLASVGMHLYRGILALTLSSSMESQQLQQQPGEKQVDLEYASTASAAIVSNTTLSISIAILHFLFACLDISILYFLQKALKYAVHPLTIKHGWGTTWSQQQRVEDVLEQAQAASWFHPHHFEYPFQDGSNPPSSSYWSFLNRVYRGEIRQTGSQSRFERQSVTMPPTYSFSLRQEHPRQSIQ